MQIVLDLFSAHVGPKTVFPLSSVCTKNSRKTEVNNNVIYEMYF